MNKLNNTTPPASRTSQRRTERRRREREKRKLLKQCNGTADQLETVTAPVSKAHRRLTVADLDNDQLEAYNGIKEWWTVQQNIGGTAKPIVLSGYSGTGKSTLMSLVLSDLENPDGSKPYIKSAAYTGKAADVLRKKGVAADTLHYLLYNWLPEGNRLVPIKKDRDEVGADLIVVDEASMLANDLRQDLEELCIPIVYLGDIGQLSAIVTDKKDNRPNVMSDPDFMLTHVHRQALESGIISVATDVRLGKNVDKGVYGVKKDMIKLGSDALNNKELIANADTVICYYNNTRHYYNDMIRTYRGFSGSLPEVGERLICIRNNREMGLVNGLVVFVKHIIYENNTLIMDLVDEVGKEFYKVQVHPEYFLGEDHPPMTGKLTKNYFEFGYALTGHKCIEENTLIETTKGKVKIKDINIGDIVYTKEGEKPVIDKIPTGKKKGYKVTLKSGKEIISSDEHQFYASSASQLPDYYELRDLKEGDFIASSLKELEYKGFRTGDLDTEMCHYIGSLIGDGCYSESYKKDYRIDIASKDLPILELFKNQAKRFGANYKIIDLMEEKGCYKGYTHSKLLRDFLKEIGLEHVTARDKRIPQEFLTEANVSQRFSILSGLFDTDGNLCSKKNRARYVTASLTLAKQMVEMMGTLGILSKYTTQILNEKPYYTVAVTGASYQKLCKGLSLKVDYKAEAAELGRKYSPKKMESDYIPFTRDLCKSLRQYLKINHIKQPFKRGFCPPSRKNLHNRYVFLKTMEKYPELEGFSSKWRGLVSYDFFYDEIVSIDPLEEDVKMYDITVEGDHNFIAAGLHTHNCQGSSFGEVVVIEENMRGRISEKRRWMYTAITRAEHKCTWISKFR